MKAVVSGILAVLFIAGLVAYLYESSVEIAAESQMPASSARP